MDMTSVTVLWAAVIVSGFYHGVNPGMGWPLAVSAALMESKLRALPKAIAMLGLGHFLAMICILLPFSIFHFPFSILSVLVNSWRSTDLSLTDWHQLS